MDPAEVARLRKKFTGLDEKLEYEPGHTIISKYDAYKAASVAASGAIGAYRTTGTSLKQEPPYSSEVRITKQVAGKVFTPSGHRTMAPLAHTASSKAGYHAERRESFNVRYEEILTAKNELRGHRIQAKQARDSERNHAWYERLHQRFS